MCNDNSIFKSLDFACGGSISKTAYSADYFLNFFKSIPESKWMTDDWHNEDKTKFCAMGHLGSIKGKVSDESRDLAQILGCNPAGINDGKNRHYQQDHPKHRIIAALNDAKMYGRAKFDEVKCAGYALGSNLIYDQSPFNKLYNFEYKIDFNPIFIDPPKMETKEVVKEVIKEVVVEKVIEKIVYVTVDQEVRQLQQEPILEN